MLLRTEDGGPFESRIKKQWIDEFNVVHTFREDVSLSTGIVYPGGYTAVNKNVANLGKLISDLLGRGIS